VVSESRNLPILIVTKLNSYSYFISVSKQMGDLAATTDSVSPIFAILWVFYPMGALVLMELIMRALSDDDDDDTSGGKGIRIRQQEMVPVPLPSGA